MQANNVSADEWQPEQKIACIFICLVFVVNLFVVFGSVAKNGDALANAALVHRKLQIKIQIVKLGWAAAAAHTHTRITRN